MTQTIIQRLNAVMSEPDAAYIQKNQKRINGQYTAVSHDQVARKLQPLFAKHGIVVAPRLLNSATVQTGRSTSKGNPIHRFEGVYDIVFYGLEGDSITITVPAHADDEGDKAPGKATSYAVKSALLKVTMMESGDEEEERVDGQPEETPGMPETAKQEFLSAFTACDSTEALKNLLKGAQDAAKAAGDVAANNELRDAAIKRANELKAATQPEEKAPEAKQETPPYKAKQETPPADAPAPPAIIKTVRRSLAAKKVSEDVALNDIAEAGKGAFERLDDITSLAAVWVMNVYLKRETTNA